MRSIFLFLLIPFSALADDGGGSDSGFLASIFAWIKGIFTAIYDGIAWLGKLFVEVFKSLFDLLTDIVVWALKGLLSLAASLINSVSDAFDITGLSQRFSEYWSYIPAEVQGVMQAIGLPSAIGIVVLGILIRFSLQLIPFVRLGS